MEVLARDFVVKVKSFRITEVSFSLPKKWCIFSISFGEWFSLVHLAFKPMFSTASSISNLGNAARDREQSTESQIVSTTQIYFPGCNYFFLLLLLFYFTEDWSFLLPYALHVSDITCMCFHWLRRYTWKNSLLALTGTNTDFTRY